ncbi:SWR1 complex subunit 2 isoform X1 [Selaginella moellendorffii]|uniref:SWR1 complex subunit 2 isoform X1 n=1 Tax=Selaginella moellendorffii TaxID=88036 RepID=UPI000D1CC112|nr:SWR1 complex subunit 2 isoform X1 [Selaginella moellendorffii]|eukprot:XP_024545569.1 SWR1 complex subunit 2 isoform X1 [Selaginella moellendorffii]
MEELPRSARATRGKRLTKLLDDEVEADNSFWGQEAFKEENNDKEYQEEAEEVDEFDSDFDQDEGPESENEVKEEKEVVKKKRKFPYKKPGADKKKKSVSFLLKNVARTDKPKPKKKAPPRPSDQEDGDGESERIIRKSTRVSVVARQAERAAKAALQTTPKPVKRKREEEKKMSQEDMLLEAAQTEVINLQSLERMLAREEEVKKKAIIQKTVYNGPQVRFISKGGYNVLEFTKVSTLPSAINSKAKPCKRVTLLSHSFSFSPSILTFSLVFFLFFFSTPDPEKALCVVTGQPARYKDPKTGQPYATKEAFKILRERFSRSGDKSSSTRRDSLEEIHQRKRTKVETERAPSSRAGVVKLKFKKSPSGSMVSSSSPQALNHQPRIVVPVLQPPPPPIDFHQVIDEADFMLEGLDDLKPDYKIEDSILYETNEKLEAQFTSGFPWHH